jgi:hypothetical protein
MLPCAFSDWKMRFPIIWRAREAAYVILCDFGEQDAVTPHKSLWGAGVGQGNAIMQKRGLVPQCEQFRIESGISEIAR